MDIENHTGNRPRLGPLNSFEQGYFTRITTL